MNLNGLAVLSKFSNRQIQCDKRNTWQKRKVVSSEKNWYNPAVEVWYYYNNEYFMDTGIPNGNAPVSWSKKPDL